MMTEQTERQRALTGRSAQPAYRYLDDPGAEEYLGLVDAKGRATGRRMKALRARGAGPHWVRIGSAVRTRTDWLDLWAEQQAVSSTSEELARRRA
jgi:hypothetical protein